MKKLMQLISLTLILALVLSFHAFAATAEDNYNKQGAAMWQRPVFVYDPGLSICHSE